MTNKKIKNKKQKKEATINDLAVVMDNKIEELALMINRSFETLAAKNDVNLLKNDVMSLREDMNKGFDKVNNSIEKMSTHMDNLADVVYADHRPRIIDLENRTHKLESKI